MKEIVINIAPVPASRPRVFKNGGRIYSKKHMQHEAALMSVLRQYAPVEPLEGAVAVSLEFVFKPYKTSKAVTYRADLDNLAKIVLDVMTKLNFWKDDYLITDLRLTKRFTEKDEEPKIIIRI